jgi:hypothetical protein
LEPVVGLVTDTARLVRSISTVVVRVASKGGVDAAIIGTEPFAVGLLTGTIFLVTRIIAFLHAIAAHARSNAATVAALEPPVLLGAGAAVRLVTPVPAVVIQVTLVGQGYAALVGAVELAVGLFAGAVRLV